MVSCVKRVFVACHACSRRRSQATTQDVDVLVPVKPKGWQAKGWPWLVVFVAQHVPRSAWADKDNE